MKKFISSMVVFLLFALCFQLSANGKEQSMTPHKDNYFIAGQEDLKFQISVKYNLIYPFDTGVYFAYTETAFWDVFKQSGPFREFNHNPEVFYQSPSFSYVDYIRLSPYEHKSNGMDGAESRSIDRAYGQIQLSYGDDYKIGTNLKGWKYYKKSSKNKDITDYSGYFEAEVFFKILSTDTADLEKEKLYVKGGCGSDYKKGWIEAGIITRILTSRIQPRLFLQGFYGYGESLIDYNVKDKQIRVGVIF